MNKKLLISIVVAAVAVPLLIVIAAISIYFMSEPSDKVDASDFKKSYSISLLDNELSLDFYENSIVTSQDVGYYKKNECADFDKVQITSDVGRVAVDIAAYSSDCEDLSLQSVNGTTAHPRTESEIKKLEDGKILDKFTTPLGDAIYYSETYTAYTNNSTSYTWYSTIIKVEDDDSNYVIQVMSGDSKEITREVAKKLVLQ